MLDEYELRQLLLLKQIIFQYKNDKISLDSLIAKIEALLDVLEEVDNVWHEKVKSLWFDIEIINAMKLTNQENFTQDDLQEISKITSSIEELINEKLE